MSGDVVFDQPFLEHRDAQSYVAIAAKVTMEGFDVVEGLTDEVFAWLEENGAMRSGSPFVRIVTSDMSAELDIEVGLPVDDPPLGTERFIVGSIPRGSYVTLFYRPNDDHDHYRANVDVQAWAASEGLAWAIDSSSGVEVWLGRFEFFRTDLSSEEHSVFELIYQIAD